VFTIPYVSLGSPAVARFQTPIVDQQVLDSLTWSRGRHAYKFGGEFRAGANDEIRDRGSSGSLTFTPLITSNLGAANTGNALASFLLGQVNAGSVQISNLLQTRASYLAFYAQHDWRVTSRLTLNYGLRWEAELPRREVSNKMNSFDPTAINPVSGTPGVVTFAGVNGTPERAFATDWNNIGPRLGFAYQVNRSGRTVLRGGTGIFYGPTVSNTIGDAAALAFDQRKLRRVTADDAERVPPERRVPGLPGSTAEQRLRSGSRRPEAQHRCLVFRSESGCADFLSVQSQPPA
jgi:hypothetical protein